MGWGGGLSGLLMNSYRSQNEFIGMKTCDGCALVLELVSES